MSVPNKPHLDRVSTRISWAIMTFYLDRLHRRKLQFHADDLRSWVIRNVHVAAPGSADRILRDMRQQGRLDYVVLSRHSSLYQFRELSQQGNLFHEEHSNDTVSTLS